MGRIADAIRTLFTPSQTALEQAVDAAVQRHAESERKEVRALIHEMEDVLEKFSRVVAREAKRRSRAMKAELDEGVDQQTGETFHQQIVAHQGEDPPEVRKARLRAQMSSRIPGLRRAE